MIYVTEILGLEEHARVDFCIWSVFLVQYNFSSLLTTTSPPRQEMTSVCSIDRKQHKTRSVNYLYIKRLRGIYRKCHPGMVCLWIRSCFRRGFINDSFSDYIYFHTPCMSASSYLPSRMSKHGFKFIEARKICFARKTGNKGGEITSAMLQSVWSIIRKLASLVCK